MFSSREKRRCLEFLGGVRGPALGFPYEPTEPPVGPSHPGHPTLQWWYGNTSSSGNNSQFTLNLSPKA